MISITTRQVRRAAIGAALLASCLGGALAAPAANAAAGCRADPVVFLSNGLKLNLSVRIAGATRADVNAITYTVDAPAGVGVTKVVYTGGALGRKERMLFVADNAPRTYDISTTVDTRATGLDVTARALVVAKQGIAARTILVSGHDHQDIVMHLTVPLPRAHDAGAGQGDGPRRGPGDGHGGQSQTTPTPGPATQVPGSDTPTQGPQATPPPAPPAHGRGHGKGHGDDQDTATPEAGTMATPTPGADGDS